MTTSEEIYVTRLEDMVLRLADALDTAGGLFDSEIDDLTEAAYDLVNAPSGDFDAAD